MKIKRYIVSNRKVFMDSLEEDLCKRNISYVTIGNEIHFLDQIIFFYDMKLDLKLIISVFLNNLNIDKKTNLDICEVLDFESKRYKETHFIDVENIENLKSEKNLTTNSTYQKRNKKINKNESNFAKQKIKKYKNNSNKFFARKI